ncbi:hypothetical protein [Rubritalea tangerina]
MRPNISEIDRCFFHLPYASMTQCHSDKSHTEHTLTIATPLQNASI